MDADAAEFSQRVISKMNERITDEIFLLIQRDRELQHEYLRLVEQSDIGLDTLNQTIGKCVKESYGLTNDVRVENPQSTLIQSYQSFQ